MRKKLCIFFFWIFGIKLGYKLRKIQKTKFNYVFCFNIFAGFISFFPNKLRKISFFCVGEKPFCNYFVRGFFGVIWLVLSKDLLGLFFNYFFRRKMLQKFIKSGIIIWLKGKISLIFFLFLIDCLKVVKKSTQSSVIKGLSKATF